MWLKGIAVTLFTGYMAIRQMADGMNVIRAFIRNRRTLCIDVSLSLWLPPMDSPTGKWKTKNVYCKDYKRKVHLTLFDVVICPDRLESSLHRPVVTHLLAQLSAYTTK
jgi:hypothetical protein